MDTNATGMNNAWDMALHEGKKEDVVNSPNQYTNDTIECIDYMKDNMSGEAFQGYLEGACKKYLHRFRYKSQPVADLKKAQWYLNKLIKEMDA